MARMAEADAQHRYSVSWIDCLARGRALGRSVLEFGDHATRDELPRDRRRSDQALRFQPSAGVPAPPWAPPGLLNRWTDRRLQRTVVPQGAPPGAGPPRSRRPASSIPWIWSRAGTGSTGGGASSSIRWSCRMGPRARCVDHWKLLSDARCASFLAVLKRFGPANPAPLSFPAPGWTLALDIPAGAAGLARPAGSTGRDGRRRGRPGVPGQGLAPATRAAGGHVSWAAGVASGTRPVGS